MAVQAKQDFPEIDFEKSILVGDSITDIEMGKRAGMKTVFIHSALENPENADLVVKSLADFSVLLENR
jgi:D-glycero-D-manno-heptose 1,7-bisphosphate phosphatase